MKSNTLDNVRVQTPESSISVYCWRPTEEGIKVAPGELMLRAASLPLQSQACTFDR